MAKKRNEGTADLIEGFSRPAIDTGPKVSSDYPNYMNVEMAVNERPGNDTGGPGFLQDQNTYERN